MQKYNIEEQLNQLNPKGLTDGEVHWLWDGIEQGINEPAIQVTQPVFGRKHSFGFMRLASQVMIVVLFFTFGSAFVAKAANDARPGDALFPVDLAIEKVRLKLASPEKKVALQLDYAKERLDEGVDILGENRTARRTKGNTDAERVAFQATLPEQKEAAATAGQGYRVQESLSELITLRGAILASGDQVAVKEIDQIISRLVLLSTEKKVALANVHVAEIDPAVTSSPRQEVIRIDTPNAPIALRPFAVDKWKTFTSGKNHFTMQYPADWFVGNWTAGDDPTLEEWVVFYMKSPFEKDKSLSGMSVRVYTKKTGSTFAYQSSTPGARVYTENGKYYVVNYFANFYEEETKRVFLKSIQQFGIKQVEEEKEEPKEKEEEVDYGFFPHGNVVDEQRLENIKKSFDEKKPTVKPVPVPVKLLPKPEAAQPIILTPVPVPTTIKPPAVGLVDCDGVGVDADDFEAGCLADIDGAVDIEEEDAPKDCIAGAFGSDEEYEQCLADIESEQDISEND